jgi:hypothetical protein
MAWLRCRLGDGMFSDEVVVTYPAAGNEELQSSVFVPSAYVRGESGHEGEVQVEVVVQKGKRYAVLPNAEQDLISPEDGDLRQQ